MRAFLILAILSLLSVACQGTDVGNPRNTRLSISGLSLRSGQNYSYDSVKISIERIELFKVGNCFSDLPADVVLKGAYVADLVANTLTPGISADEIPAGSYCRIRLKLSPRNTGEFKGASVRAIGGVGQDEDLVIKVFSDQFVSVENLQFGFFVGPGNPLVLVFDLDIWLNEIALAGLSRVGNDIEISENRNGDAELQFLANFRASAALFIDQNGNGILDAREAENDIQVAVPGREFE